MLCKHVGPNNVSSVCTGLKRVQNFGISELYGIELVELFLRNELNTSWSIFFVYMIKWDIREF